MTARVDINSIGSIGRANRPRCLTTLTADN
jgi:hypothetical protein